MIESFAVFIAAMAFLIISSEKTIDAVIKICEYTGISRLTAGFIIIAIVVSLPDLVVSVVAALDGKPALGIGDALGSSIANICLVLGVATLLRKISVERRHTLESSEFLLLISLVPAWILSKGAAGNFEGGIMLLLFVLYCLFVVKTKMTLKLSENIPKKEVRNAILFFLAGVAIVIVSAHYVVNSASEIAKMLGVSDAIIGLTLVSFGTTLPELALDFAAIRKGHIALAIGDILGSTVVNLTLILGLVILVSPGSVNLGIYTIPLAFIIMANSFLSYSLVKHEGIGQKQGLIFLLMYILFIMLMFASSGIY